MPYRPVRSSGPGQLEDLAVGDLELAHEQLEHVRVDRSPRPRGGPAARTGGACSSLLERLEQVLGVVLLDLEVLVAGDPERVVLEDLHAREELVEVRGDDVLERDEALVADRRRSAAGSAAP